MNSRNDLNAQIQDLKTTASEKLDTRISSAISKSLPRAEKSHIWRIIMKRNIAKFASCIVVLIITAILVIHFSGEKIDFANTAFADVMEKIYKAKNVTYTQKMITSKTDSTNRFIATDTGLVRSEDQYQTSLIDWPNGIQMDLYPAQKKCIKTQTVGRNRTDRPYIWLELIQKMHSIPAEYSHSEVLDKKNTEVFLIEKPYEKTTIWVDPNTDLPVKIIREYFKNTKVVMPMYVLLKTDFGGSQPYGNGIGIGGGSGIMEDGTVTMTDFVWDSELDPSLFSFKVPDDWEVEEKKELESKIEKEDLIKALSFWAEMSGGKFPNKINDMMDHDHLNPLLVKKFNIGGDPDEQFDQACEQAYMVLSGLYFAQEKIANCDWHYDGAEVDFGDTDTPIAWWQNEEDDTWTIIYGDLSFNETAEEPPL